MIDPAILQTHSLHNAAPHSDKARLVMRRDPDARMAGSVPVWHSKNAPAQKTDSSSFEKALHYADPQTPDDPVITATDTSSVTNDDEFTFEDLIDIVNPLHHVPLINVVYQSLTGDTIKPAGRIIGGAVFGGFVGAAAGVVNVIAEEETGKDVAGNIVALMTEGELPQAKPSRLSPEDQLDNAARIAFNNDADIAELSPHAYGLQATTSARVQAQAQAQAHTHTSTAPYLPHNRVINPVGITEADYMISNGAFNPFAE